MKKLALLLAALGVVSAAAYAAPELTVTNVGQEIEMEHKNGTDDTTAWLFNNVGLKYDDWSFSLQAGKQWNYDNDDNGADKDSKGVTSNDSRLQFDVAKPVTDNLTLKGRYRGQKTFDRFQVGYDYKYGMFLSSGDVFYDFTDANGKDSPDTFHAELFPVGAKLGPVTVKYYLEYVEDLGERSGVERESYTEHQIRVYAPLYKNGNFSLSTEGRFTVKYDEDHVSGGYEAYKDFGRDRLYLKANYAVSENLNVYANYFYELREREGKNGFDEKKLDNADVQNLVLGWSYTF